MDMAIDTAVNTAISAVIGSAEKQTREALEPASMLRWAEIKMQDAENTAISRNTRVEAAFDSIYARLSVLARRAGEPEPFEHPSERVIVSGAAAAGLNACCVNEVLNLHHTVAGHRHSLSAHPVSLTQALALVRHLEKMAKS